MPRKFIDVYDLQDHTNEMTAEIVPEIVKKVGGTGGSGTATNIADWAEKDSTIAIPIDKELALPEHVPASLFEGNEHAADTSVSLGSLFKRVYSLTGAMDYTLRATEDIGNPTGTINYSKIVEEANWASYVNDYPSLFSTLTGTTSGGSTVVTGIYTTIQKITDTLVNLMSSSGSSGGSSTLPIIVCNSNGVYGPSSSVAPTYRDMSCAETYSSFRLVNVFSDYSKDSEDNKTGIVANYKDAAIAGAFLDGIFNGSVPSYSSATVNTGDFTADKTSINYVFKVTIDSKKDGVYTCTAYYLDTEDKTTDNGTETTVTVKKATVYSKTTMPFLV